MATIVISAEKVIQAAEDVIARIAAERNKRNEKMISKEMKDSFESKFFFFRGEPVSRERAIKKLTDRVFSYYPVTMHMAT